MSKIKSILAFATLMLCGGAWADAGVISINMGRDTRSFSSTSPNQNTLAGDIPVADWIVCSQNNGVYGSATKDDVTVTWDIPSRPGDSCDTRSIPIADTCLYFKGGLCRGNRDPSAYSIDVSGITFDSYKVYIYFTWDKTADGTNPYPAVTVNDGTSYYVSNGALVEGDSKWGTGPDTTVGYTAPELWNNAMLITGLSGSTLNLSGNCTKGAVAAIQIVEVVPPTPSFTFTGNATGGAVTGWATSLSEGSGTSHLGIGPDGMNKVTMIYQTSGSDKWHPWGTFNAIIDKDFSLAMYMNLEAVNKLSGQQDEGTSTKGSIIYHLGQTFHLIYKEGELQLADSSGAVISDLKIPESAVTPGYHLVTLTFSKTEGLALYLDDGSVCAKAPDYKTALTSGGYQFGLGSGDFKRPYGLMIANMFGYEKSLTSAEIATLSCFYPAKTVVLKTDIDVTDNKTIVFPSATTDGNHMVAGTHGKVVIPAGVTVSTPHLRFLNNSSTANNVTLELAGTVNVTSTLDGETCYAQRGSYKGVLFGHWHGQGTYNVTGTLNAENTYIDMCFTAEAQTLNVDGGTVKAKGIYSDSSTYGTINLSNDGTLELSSSNFIKVPVTSAGGTIKAGETATYGKALTLTGGTTTLVASDSKTLTLNETVSGSGALEVVGDVILVKSTGLTGATTVTSGTLTVNSDHTGLITVADDATIKIKVTEANIATGYTAANVTLPAGGNVIFVKPDGTEIEGTTGNVLPASAPTWTGAGDDGNWDTAANWSTDSVPTADTPVMIDTDATIALSNSSSAKAVYVKGDVKFTGTIANDKIKNIEIDADKTLTFESANGMVVHGLTGGAVVKSGTGTLTVKNGTNDRTFKDATVTINGGQIKLDGAKIENVDFVIADSAITNGAIPLDCYGWPAVPGRWSVSANRDVSILNNTGANPSAITGSGAFEKRGTGKVTVLSSFGNSGNAYSGSLTVSAGTLELSPRNSETSHNPNVSGKITVAQGAKLNVNSTTASFTHNGASDTSDIAGELNIMKGVVEMKGSDRGLRGTLTIAKDAEFKITRGDYFSYNGDTVTVNVYGTLDFGTNRQTLRNTVALNFYSGSTIKGYGDNSDVASALQIWNADHNGNIKFLRSDDDETGLVTFNVALNLQNSVTFDVARDVEVVCGPATSEENTRNLVHLSANDKKLIKTGAGVLKIMTDYTTPTVLSEGTLVLPDESTATVDKADANKKIEVGEPMDGYRTYTLALRDSLYLYYTEGYFNASAEGNQPTLKNANADAMTYLAGDTVVIANATAEHPGFSGSEIYCSNTAFAKIKIEKDLTIHAGGDFAILGNAEVEVAQGVTVKIVAGSGHTGYTFGSGLTLKGKGKVVFDTVLPTEKVVGNDWTGTCTIKNKIGDRYNFEPNDFANENSSLELNGVKFYVDDNNTLYDAKEVIITDNGNTPGYTIYNGFYDRVVKFKALKGEGKLYSEWESTQRYVFLDASEFNGSIQTTAHDQNKRIGIIIGNPTTVPGYDVAKGKVIVTSGATLNIAFGKSVSVANCVEVAGTITGSGTIANNLVLTDAAASVTVAAVSGTITTTVEDKVVKVVENAGLKTYTLVDSVPSVASVTINGETTGYPTIEAAIEAAAAADGAVITLTDPSAAAPAGFTKREGGVLKACDYVVISPNAYVSDWQAYVTARQAMPAAEGLVLGVKNAAEIYTAYPYASTNVNGDPRNAAESIHKWIGIMQKLGTKYFVLGGVWMDAQKLNTSGELLSYGSVAHFATGEAISLETAIPGITAYPVRAKGSLAADFTNYPSDLFYACQHIEAGAKYVWDSNADGAYLNPEECEAAENFVPSCVVARMGFVPEAYGESKKTYPQLIQAYLAKLTRCEADNFGGNGKYIAIIDRCVSYDPVTSLPDTYAIMRDRLYSVVNTRTANELYLAPFNKAKQEQDQSYMTPTINRAMNEDWEISMPFGHGVPDGCGYIDIKHFKASTGVTKFFMANIPCYTGSTTTFSDTQVLRPSIAQVALSNPNGGSLVSINNTCMGQAAESGLTQRYMGISDEMFDYTLDSYVSGATAGEAWMTAIKSYANNVLSDPAEVAKRTAKSDDANANASGVSLLSYVISAVVEEMLFGDPLVAINERDVYVKNDTGYSKYYTTKAATQETTLRAADRIVFDRAAFDPTVAVDLTTAPTGHRIYFAPSTQGAPTAWKTTNGIPAGLQVLIGANTSFALYGQSAVNDGVIFSGEGTLTRTDSPDSPVDITGLVQVYSAVSTPKARSMLFALASANAVLKVKEKLADGMVGGSIGISAMCNDFGDAGATYTATVEGDAPESMKTVVVPEGATKLYLLPSQTADLSAVNQASLSEIKVVLPNPYEETTIDMTGLFEQSYNADTHILSLNLKESAAPAPEKLSVAMPGGKDEGKIKITIQNPIKGLCYSIVTADSPDGFAEDQIVDESERMQVMYAYSSIPLTLTYDPKKKVQYFKVRVSPSTKYGK